MWIATITTNNTFSAFLWWNLSNQIYTCKTDHIKKWIELQTLNHFYVNLHKSTNRTPVFVDVTFCVCEPNVSVIVWLEWLQINKHRIVISWQMNLISAWYFANRSTLKNNSVLLRTVSISKIIVIALVIFSYLASMSWLRNLITVSWIVSSG